MIERLAIIVHDCYYEIKLRMGAVIKAQRRHEENDDMLLVVKLRELQVAKLRSKGHECMKLTHSTSNDTSNLVEICQFYINTFKDFTDKLREKKYYFSSLVDKLKLTIEQYTKTAISSINIKIFCQRALIEMKGAIVELIKVNVNVTPEEMQLSTHDLQMMWNGVAFRMEKRDPEHPSISCSLHKWNLFRIEVPVPVSVVSKHLIVRFASLRIDGSCLDPCINIKLNTFRLLVISNLVFSIDSDNASLHAVYRKTTPKSDFTSHIMEMVACSIRFTDTFLTISALTGHSSLCFCVSNGCVNKTFDNFEIQSRISSTLYCFDGISHGWEVIWTNLIVKLCVTYERKQNHMLQINVEFFDNLSLTISNRTLCSVCYMLRSIHLSIQSRETSNSNKLYSYVVWIQNETLLSVEYSNKEDCNGNLGSGEIKQLSRSWNHYDHLIRGPMSNCSSNQIQLRIEGEHLGIVNLSNQFCSFVVHTAFGNVVVDVINRPNPHSLLQGLLIRVRSPVRVSNNCTVELHLASIAGAKVAWQRVLKSKQRIYLPSCKEAVCLNGEIVKCLSETAYSLAQDRSEIIHLGCHGIRVDMVCQKCQIQVIFSDPLTVSNQLLMPLHYTLIGSNIKYDNIVDVKSIKTAPRYGLIKEIQFYTTAPGSGIYEDVPCCRLNLENYAKGERALIMQTVDAQIPINVVFDNSIKNGLSVLLYPQAVIRCQSQSDIYFKFVNSRFDHESTSTDIPEVLYRKSNANKIDNIVFPRDSTVNARMPSSSTYSLLDLSSTYAQIQENRNCFTFLAISSSTSKCRNYKIWCLRDLFCIVNRSCLDLRICLLSHKWEKISRKSTVYPRWSYPFQSRSDSPVTLKLRICMLGKLLGPVAEIVIDRREINVSFAEAREGKVHNVLKIQSQMLHTNQIEITVEESMAPYRFVNHTAIALKVREDANYPWNVVNGNDSRSFVFSEKLNLVQLSTATNHQTDPVFLDLENFTKTTIRHLKCFSIRKGKRALMVDLSTHNTHPTLCMTEFNDCASQHWYADGDRLVNIRCAALGRIHVLDVQVSPESLDPLASYKLVLGELDEQRSLFQKWQFVDKNGVAQEWSDQLGEGRVVNRHMKHIGIQLSGIVPCVDSLHSLVSVLWSSHFSSDLVLSKRYQNHIQLFDINYLDKEQDLVMQIAVTSSSCGISLVHRAANLASNEVALITIDEISARSSCVFEYHDRFQCTSQSSTLSAKSLQVLDQSSPANAPPVISFVDANDTRRFKRSLFASFRTSGFVNWIDRFHVNIAPLNVWIDESFVLGVIQFGLDSIPCESAVSTSREPNSSSHIRIRNLLIDPIQATITVRGRTSANLPAYLIDLKSQLNIPSMSNLVNISDASLKFETINLKSLAGSDQIMSNVCKRLIQSYYTSIRSQLIYVLGSVDFIGNPMRIADSVKSGLIQSLISEDSSVLIGGILHGLADATCKIAECLSDSFKQPDQSIDRHVLNTTSHAIENENGGVLRSVFRAALAGMSGQMAGTLNIVQDIAQVVKDETKVTSRVHISECPRRRSRKWFFIDANSPYCLTPSSLSDDDIQSLAGAHLSKHEVVINAFSNRNNYFHNSEIKAILITRERIILTFDKHETKGESSAKSISFEIRFITDIAAEASILTVRVKKCNAREFTLSFKCVDVERCTLARQNLQHCVDYVKKQFRYADYNE